MLKPLQQVCAPFYVMLLLSLAGCRRGSEQTQTPTIGPESDNFVLAYVTGTPLGPPHRVNVRWTSGEGTLNWRSSGFPTSLDPGSSGVGLMVDEHSVTSRTLTRKGSNEVQFLSGVVPNSSWDDTGPSPSSPTTPKTSPVGVVLDDAKYAVALTGSGDKVAILIYDASTRQFGANIAPQGSLNSNVQGRPDMVRLGNKIVVAWRRGTSLPHDLVAAVGTVTGETATFSSPQEIPTPAAGDIAQGILSDPALARTGNQFHIIVVRSTSGGGLTAFRTRQFRSSDGVSWTTSNTGNPPLDHVDNVTHLGLAGLPSGVLVAVAVSQNGGTPEMSGAKFSAGAWQAMSASQVSDMFSLQPAFRPFSLTGVQRSGVD